MHNQEQTNIMGLRIFSVLIIILMIFVSCFEEYDDESGSQTIILQPDEYVGKDAIIVYYSSDSLKDLNFGTHPSILVSAWNSNDQLKIIRALIEFDFLGIPPGSTVINARLSLYFNPTDETYSSHSSLSGSNECIIERITGEWHEDTVTWNNQPQTSPENIVILPATTENSQNYLDINVTAMVQDMVNKPIESFGFMLRLRTEQYYRALVFASSDNIKGELHPKLQIAFTLPEY